LFAPYTKIYLFLLYRILHYYTSNNNETCNSHFGSYNIWGSKTNNGVSIFGGTDYGFDGSLNDSTSNAVTDSKGFIKKLKAEETCNFSYTGKIILPITKNAKNYLVINKDFSAWGFFRYIGRTKIQFGNFH